MKRTNKKGFTIVELVIVIAVIAILAAVLIPTFAGIIHKANVSNDTQLVKNLNTALAADTTANYTMTDALEAAAEFGYDIEKINASATDNEILWDSANNVFCYFNEDKIEYIPESSIAITDVKDYQYWVISSTLDEKYSTYFTGNVADLPTDDNGTVIISNGFDAGTTTDITALKYERADDGVERTVAIRTNSADTTLTINAPSDSVKHFGEAKDVVIEAVKTESYHIFGTVAGNIEVKAGRVVVESGAVAPTIVVTATETGKVFVDVRSAVKPSIVATVEAVANTLSSVVTGGANVSDTVANADDLAKFAGGLGTKDSPYLIATKEQFLAINDFGADMAAAKEYYFKLVADIEISKTDYLSDNDCGANWIGTRIINNLCGEFDGNNHKIIIKDSMDGTVYIFNSLYGNTTIRDLTFDIPSIVTLVCNTYDCVVVLDNVDMISSVEETIVLNNANDTLYFAGMGFSYIDYARTAVDVTLKNCDIDLEIAAEGNYTSLFIGHTIRHSDTVVKFEDCSFSGVYSGPKISPILANTSPDNTYGNGKLVIKNFVNNGTILGTEGYPAIIGASGVDEESVQNAIIYPVQDNVTIENCNWGTMQKASDVGLAVSAGDNGLVITPGAVENATYQIRITAGRRIFLKDDGTYAGENSSYAFTIDVESLETAFKAGYLVTADQFAEMGGSTENFATYAIKEGTVKCGEYEGTYYYVFDFTDDGYAFGDFDKDTKIVNAKPVATGKAAVNSYNGSVLAGSASCEFKPAN